MRIMSRKEINRYYPPDMDPKEVKFGVKTAKKDPNVRLMIPFSMKCTLCNEYVAKSRKFNARKETTEKHYLGIKIIRFRIRCPQCYAEMIFETDPKNGDYTCVENCKKNYERAKEIKEKETVDEMIARLEKEMEEEEKMKKLEKGINQHDTHGAGVEQLEKRLSEQQKEKERIEELEELQEKVNDLDTRKKELNLSQIDIKIEKKLDEEAKRAFSSFRKEQSEGKQSFKLKTDNFKSINGYSDSDDDENGIDDKFRSKILTNNTTEKSKRKKRKIIT